MPGCEAAAFACLVAVTLHHEGSEGWQPGFSDYLYLSLTNAASFAPAIRLR